MSISRAHDWKSGLQRVGTYYEGYIDDPEPVLEDYRRDTVTSWGTRRSSSAKAVVDKENTSPCPNSEVNYIMQCVLCNCGVHVHAHELNNQTKLFMYICALSMWSQSSGGHTTEFISSG